MSMCNPTSASTCCMKTNDYCKKKGRKKEFGKKKTVLTHTLTHTLKRRRKKQKKHTFFIEQRMQIMGGSAEQEKKCRMNSTRKTTGALIITAVPVNLGLGATQRVPP